MNNQESQYKGGIRVIKWNYKNMEVLDNTGVSVWKFYTTWFCNFWRVKKWENWDVIEVMVSRPFWYKES